MFLLPPNWAPRIFACRPWPSCFVAFPGEETSREDARLIVHLEHKIALVVLPFLACLDGFQLDRGIIHQLGPPRLSVPALVADSKRQPIASLLHIFPSSTLASQPYIQALCSMSPSPIDIDRRGSPLSTFQNL